MSLVVCWCFFAVLAVVSSSQKKLVNLSIKIKENPVWSHFTSLQQLGRYILSDAIITHNSVKSTLRLCQSVFCPPLSWWFLVVDVVDVVDVVVDVVVAVVVVVVVVVVVGLQAMAGLGSQTEVAEIKTIPETRRHETETDISRSGRCQSNLRTPPIR